jgi:hypothetical protein
MIPGGHVKQVESLEAARDLLEQTCIKAAEVQSVCLREGQALAPLLIVPYHELLMITVQSTSDPYDLDRSDVTGNFAIKTSSGFEIDRRSCGVCILVDSRSYGDGTAVLP